MAAFSKNFRQTKGGGLENPSENEIGDFQPNNTPSASEKITIVSQLDLIVI